MWARRLLIDRGPNLVESGAQLRPQLANDRTDGFSDGPTQVAQLGTESPGELPELALQLVSGAPHLLVDLPDSRQELVPLLAQEVSHPRGRTGGLAPFVAPLGAGARALFGGGDLRAGEQCQRAREWKHEPAIASGGL